MDYFTASWFFLRHPERRLPESKDLARSSARSNIERPQLRLHHEQQVGIAFIRSTGDLKRRFLEH
jgi:hypothetical protein